MDQTEFLQHWNYFCSLASKLDSTRDYVYHGLKDDGHGEPIMIHGNVYSDIFKQIIILSASEFEVVSKVLCGLCGETSKNIVEISRALLQHFPKIIKTEIITAYYLAEPMKDWRIESGNKVIGLEWWKAYNSLKHNEVDSN